ncbi:MAG TPA: dihydrolipoamide acetyltransferase family protein [Anaerolineales bacterium]|nr:dihydrolipoamide acetyltransferase family protein [Anaerolineales bacterium]
MAVEIILPKVDMDQETGTIVEWRKSEGEQVTEGEILLVIETDKVAIDVEAPGSGKLAGVSGKPGDVFPIGTVIGFLLAEGEEFPQQEQLPAANGEPVPASTSAPEPSPVSATPVARNMAATHGIDLGTVSSGDGKKITKADVQAKLAEQTQPVVDGKVYAVPAARRVARENNLALEQVAGSGPDGRIQSTDVLAFMAQQKQTTTAPVMVSAEAQVVPLIGMRKTIAERMTANYQNVPHIKFTSRVVMDGFSNARSRLNDLAKNSDEQKISATAMFVKLVAAALTRHPYLNSSLNGDDIVLHQEINIGVAVALKDGLIVPVVKNADSKSLSQIAKEVADLVERARDGKLLPSEVKGGTFTISNLGLFGIEQFDAIINAPEAAILAIGATQLEAVPEADGQIVSRPVMRVTLSADHRIVDGAVAAQFMADLKTVFEEPLLMVY